MLLDKDPYCKCVKCGFKQFKDISYVTVKIIKNEFGDDMMITNSSEKRFKCAKCGKEMNEEELYENYLKE